MRENEEKLDLVEVIFDLGEAHPSGLRNETLMCIPMGNEVFMVNETPRYFGEVKRGDHISFEILENPVGDDVYYEWHFRGLI